MILTHPLNLDSEFSVDRMNILEEMVWYEYMQRGRMCTGLNFPKPESVFSCLNQPTIGSIVRLHFKYDLEITLDLERQVWQFNGVDYTKGESDILLSNFMQEYQKNVSNN